MQVLSKIIIKYIKGCDFIKKLPKIYQNSIDKHINNNKKTCYIRNITDKENIVLNTMDNNEIDLVIDEIFNDIGYSFNIPVIIKTNNKTYETSLITRTNGYLLTLDNQKIKLDDIVFIQRKNPK